MHYVIKDVPRIWLALIAPILRTRGKCSIGLPNPGVRHVCAGHLLFKFTPAYSATPVPVIGRTREWQLMQVQVQLRCSWTPPYDSSGLESGIAFYIWLRSLIHSGIPG